MYFIRWHTKALTNYRMCAMNALGCSANVSVLASTDFDREEVQAAKEEKRAVREEEEEQQERRRRVSLHAQVRTHFTLL